MGIFSDVHCAHVNSALPPYRNETPCWDKRRIRLKQINSKDDKTSYLSYALTGHRLSPNLALATTPHAINTSTNSLEQSR